MPAIGRVSVSLRRSTGGLEPAGVTRLTGPPRPPSAVAAASPRPETPARPTDPCSPVGRRRFRLLRPGTRTQLDADRVGDPAEELNVRVVDPPGAVADPHEVRGQIVDDPGGVLGAGERPLVVE